MTVAMQKLPQFLGFSVDNQVILLLRFRHSMIPMPCLLFDLELSSRTVLSFGDKF